jgi:stearoyl-CoA desaturase (delta-9 desaturase)
VLIWACEHRNHHKHVDHADDPYCIAKGFFHAHIGWLLFKLDSLPPFDNVADLQKDPLVMWQHRYVHWIAALVAFVFPAMLGFAWGGWSSALGAFLIAGSHALSFFSTALSATSRFATMSATARIRLNAAHAIGGSWRS